MSQAVARSRKETKERDLLVRRIVEALDAGVDPELFERCVCDLLRDVFPSLVPISGGSDQGMDGAIAEGEAEAFPLICTTAEDAARNLRTSWESYGKGRWPRKKAVFVTSRRLTPETRRRLQKIARDQDFRLVQIVDQDGIVDRLYRSTRWKKELGVNVAAPALSRVPQSLRPSREIPLIGRDEDVDWLKGTSGDRVLSGQPGSGKTHLLRHLVDQGWGLFLVSDDRTEVRGEILEQRLDEVSDVAVIVDDAHGDTVRISMLRQLREELGGSFPIIATCWPGALEEVSSALGAGETSTREMQLLTRNQIVEVLAAAGVTEEYVSEHLRADSKTVIRRLVDQAANRPGLAVTLATLALRGDWEETLTGKALRRELSAFKNLLGTDPTPALAAFAFGGEIGMPLATVASFVDSTEATLQRLVIGLAFGGVLEDNPYEKTLSVRPRALRSALLQQVFFQGRPTDLDADRLLGEAHSRRRSIEAVLWSKEAGAVLDQEWIRSIVAESNSLHFWRLFASHGSEEAHWVLDNYSGDFLDVAEAALDWVPETVISKLLEVVGGASQRGETLSGLKDPAEMLKRWLSADGDSSLGRRRLLAGVATDSLKRGVHQEAGLRFLFTALSPRLSTESWDPGLGNTLTASSHHVGTLELGELKQLWRQARGSLPRIQSSWLPILHGGLWEWIYPDFGGGLIVREEGRSLALSQDDEGQTSSGELADQMRRFSGVMLRDLAGHAGDSPALLSALDRLARLVDLSLELPLDEDYEILFPRWYDGDEGEESSRDSGQDETAKLTERWSARGSRWVAEQLYRLLAEARDAEHFSQNRIPEVMATLARTVDAPVAWAEALGERDLLEQVVEPFLRYAEEAGEDGWDRVAASVLQREQVTGEVFRLVVTLDSPPAHLLDLALQRAPSLVHVIRFLGHEVPVATMRRLLESKDQGVSVTAAGTEWSLSPGTPRSPRKEVAAEWRAAVLRASQGSPLRTARHWLKEALASDKSLALEWLVRRIDENLEGLASEFDTYGFAVKALDKVERVSLLDRLQRLDFHPSILKFVIFLVGDEPDTYDELLKLSGMKRYHLSPLFRQRPASLDDHWARMAAQAAKAGHDSSELARETVFGSGRITIAGSGVKYWQGWADGFSRFLEDSRSEVRAVAQEGRNFTEDRIEKSQAEKRKQELEGL